jgi:hypothetical protein
MRKNLGFLLVFALVTASAGTAAAGGQAGSFGVGVETDLLGSGGLSLNYDAGRFHTGGFLGYSSDGGIVGGGGDDLLQFGGRFYYHLHSTAMSDFSVGTSLGLAFVDQGQGNDNLSVLYLQPGFQIRLFLSSNVAFSAAAGLGIATLDVDTVVLGTRGNLFAGLGLHYYFF